MASNVLKTFASQYFPKDSIDAILAEIDKTGTISDTTLAQAGIKKPSTVSFIKDQIGQLGGKSELKDLTQTQLKSIAGIGNDNPIDESTLDDQGLRGREQIFNQLGQTKGELDRGTIERTLQQMLKGFGVKNNVDALSQQITDGILQTGKAPTPEDILGKFGNGDPALNNFANDQNARNQISKLVTDQVTPYDSYDDTKRIDDLLSARKTSAGNEQELQDFVQSMPDALATSRNDYVDALGSQYASSFPDEAQVALNQENASGRLNSGAAGDALSSIYSGHQADLENIQASLTNEDNQMYANAAYQEQLRKMLEGQTDYSTALASEQSRVRNDQQNRFLTSQNEANTNTSNSLQMQKYNNAVIQAQKKAQQAADYASGQKKAGLIGGIGQTIGGIAATGIGVATANPLLIAGGVGLTAGGAGQLGAQ